MLNRPTLYTNSTLSEHMSSGAVRTRVLPRYLSWALAEEYVRKFFMTLVMAPQAPVGLMRSKTR